MLANRPSGTPPSESKMLRLASLARHLVAVRDGGHEALVGLCLDPAWADGVDPHPAGRQIGWCCESVGTCRTARRRRASVGPELAGRSEVHADPWAARVWSASARSGASPADSDRPSRSGHPATGWNVVLGPALPRPHQEVPALRRGVSTGTTHSRLRVSRAVTVPAGAVAVVAVEVQPQAVVASRRSTCGQRASHI